MASQRPWLVAIPLILAPFLLLSPVYLAGKALYWGTPILQFVPWRMWAWETLLSGHLPLWNPLLGTGMPLLANYQSGFFYPPNWLYFLLAAAGGLPALAWGQAMMVAFHLAWAGVGMALLVRCLGLKALSQIISGLAFGCSAYLVTRSGFLSINAAVAWLPWILIAGWQLGTGAVSRRRSVLNLAFLCGMQLLAGHAQITWYTFLLLVIWISFWALNAGGQAAANANSFQGDSQKIGISSSSGLNVFTWGGFPAWLRRLTSVWLTLGMAFALALALAAIQILPTAEYLVQSQRASTVEYEMAMTYSFWPWRILGLITPGLYGTPATGNYWGYANYWEDAIYIGMLPFLLALSALRIKRHPKKYKPLTILLAGLILVSFILALGKNTPIFPWLYHNIPTFGLFNAPTRFTIWAIFALSLLAGLGAENWSKPEGRSLYWVRLGTAGAFAVAIGAGLAWLFLGDISPSFVQATALAGFLGLGAGLLTLLAPSAAPTGDSGRSSPLGFSSIWDNRWALGVISLVVCDLLIANWGMNPAIQLDIYSNVREKQGKVARMVAGGRIYLPLSDERQLKFDRFFRFDTFNNFQEFDKLPASLLPNLSMLAGIPAANNFDPLLPGRYSTWMDAYEQAGEAARERMMNLMAVKVVETIDDSDPNGLNFRSIPSLPRIRWVSCASFVENEEEALRRVLEGGYDHSSMVILEGLGLHASPACLGEGEAELRMVSENPNELVMEIQAETPGYLVIADLWYPGWRAWLSGETLPVLRADYLFRAVEIPAGTHLVRMAYRPLWFYAGAGLSAVAWLGLIVFIGWSRRRSFYILIMRW
jgi:hypothetical protein